MNRTSVARTSAYYAERSLFTFEVFSSLWSASSILWQLLLLHFWLGCSFRLRSLGASGSLFLLPSLGFFRSGIRCGLTQLWFLRLFLLEVVQRKSHNCLLELLHFSGALLCLFIHLTFL